MTSNKSFSAIHCGQSHATCLFSSVQSLSHVPHFATPWTAACQASLSITNSWSLLKLTSMESVTPSNHVIVCRPLLLLTSIFPCIRVFSKHAVSSVTYPIVFGFFPFEYLFGVHSSYVPDDVPDMYFSHICVQREIQEPKALCYTGDIHIIIRYLTVIYYVKYHMYVCMCTMYIQCTKDTEKSFHVNSS